MYSKEYLLGTGYYLNNEYFDKYVELLVTSEQQQVVKHITQQHHIIPRHYFTEKELPVDNSAQNIVILNYKDHMLCHLYLSGCTEGRHRYWNLYSIFYMSGKETFYDIEEMKQRIDATEFDRLYEEAIKAAPNHRKGTKCSEETLRKMSEARRNRPSPSRGRIWVNNGEEDRMIYPQDLFLYEDEGYVLGRKYRHSEETKKRIGEYGRTRIITDEFREKMKISATNQVHTPEQIAKQKQTMKEYYKTHPGTFLGKHHTQEANQKNREAHIGRVFMNNGEIEKHVKPEEIQKYISEGFIKGRLKRNKQLEYLT